MFKHEEHPSIRQVLLDILRPLLYRLLTLPALLIWALRPLRSAYPFYPERLREFFLHWSNAMVRTYVFSFGTRLSDQPCTIRLPTHFQPRVDAPASLRLSEKEIREFYEKGFLGPFTLCSREEMFSLHETLSNETARASSTYGFVTGRDRHLDCSSVGQLAERPELVERLAQILGPNLLLWRSQIFLKDPGAPAVAWHQASTYLMEALTRPALFPPDRNQLFQLGAWLALDDVDETNGCMRVFPGSHLRIRPMRIGKSSGPRFAKVNIALEHEYSEKDAVSLPMRAGQFVIFTEQVIHGSLPNTSERRRCGIAFRVVPPEVGIYVGARSHPVAYLKEDYPLDRWGAVLLRGEDNVGINRLLTIAKAKS